MDLIVAINFNQGIGYQGKIPWHSHADLKHFRKHTLNKTIIVGRKTAMELPYLEKRSVTCLSRGCPNTSKWKNKVRIIKSIDEILPDNALIAGGAQIYCTALERPGFVRRVYLTIVEDDSPCDTYFNMRWLKGFIIINEKRKSLNNFLILERGGNAEHMYLSVLNQTMQEGNIRTGRNGVTSSLFMKTIKFDLREGFPLLTTKKMFLRGILEEFLFFLRGDTDSNILSAAKVRIWEGNTNVKFLESRGLPYARGVMGPMYGYQWRHFNAPYHLDSQGHPLPPRGGIDQLANVIKLIKEEPNSRRILMTAYNPIQAEQGVLYPCHSIVIQFYVDKEYLDMSCYNRSQDMFLGVPYNIASSSLLLMIIAKLTSKTPRFFHMIMGDAHIYECHFEQVKLQLTRIPYPAPCIKLPEIVNLSDISRVKASDFILSDYVYHSSIRASMMP